MQRHAFRGLIAVGAATAAAVLWHHLPANSDIFAPFDVEGTVGETVSGRAITATVSGVRVGDVVSSPKPLAAMGRWVIVDAEVRPGDTTEFPHADLLVGSDTYTPTDRLPPGVGLGAAIQPGISTRGSWVFDVAPSALDTGTPLTVRLWVGSGWLDSRLTIVIDLKDPRVTTEDTVRVNRPDRAAS